MTNLNVTASSIRKVADKIEFANALLATSDPVIQARAIASYDRIAADANRLTKELANDDHLALMHAARLEVAQRRVLRREEAAFRAKRRDELNAMRADLDSE